MRVLYTILALLVLGGYAWADFHGKEFRRSKRERLTRAGVRGATGGGYIYAHRGYQGGK
jgi:hypothetical protein